MGVELSGVELRSRVRSWWTSWMALTYSVCLLHFLLGYVLILTLVFLVSWNFSSSSRITIDFRDTPIFLCICTLSI